MGKYEPLAESLAKVTTDSRKITFAELEKILGAPLPPTARKQPEWWANNSNGHSQALGWLNAGFRTTEVNLEGETVTFVRDETPARRRHPIFGCMKGQVVLADDLDLTEPALPPEEWEEIENKYNTWI